MRERMGGGRSVMISFSPVREGVVLWSSTRPLRLIDSGQVWWLEFGSNVWVWDSVSGGLGLLVWVWSCLRGEHTAGFS